MAYVTSNTFSIRINKAEVAQTSLNTQVIIYKGTNQLSAVSGTPGTNEYKVSITGTTNCSARLENDYKTITLTSVSSNNGQINISINVENVKTYTKTISVANIIATSSLKNVSNRVSTVEQTVDSITTRVSSVETSANNAITKATEAKQTAEGFNQTITSNLSNNYYRKTEIDTTIEGIQVKFDGVNNKLSNSIITIDTNGVTVKHSDGSKTVMDSYGINMYNSNNVLYQRLRNGKMYFTTPNGEYVGALGQNYWTNDTSKYLSAVNAEYGHTVGLGAKYTSGASSYTAPLVVSSINQTISGAYYYQGLNLRGTPYVFGTLYFPSTSSSSDNYPSLITANSSGNLVIFGDNSCSMGIKVGTTNKNGVVVTEDSSNNNKCHIDMWGPLNMNNYGISNTTISKALNATSAASYSLRDSGYSDPNSGELTNIYSIQSVDKGDVRWTDRQTYFTSEVEEGVYECYVELPWWLAQNIGLDYHVNITPTNGFFQYYVSERDPYYFIVRSDKDSMGFTFELVATLLEQNTLDSNVSIASDQYTSVDVNEDNAPEIPLS